MSGKKGADWYDESDRDKVSMLSACAKGMTAEVERYLVSGGVDVEEEDDDGATALQIASAKGHRSLVELLLRKGAQVDRANYAGMTPFLHACREGHQDIVTMLANHGANLHVTAGLGMSAMAFACAGRHMGVVRTLRGLNAAVNVAQGCAGHQVAPSAFMVAFFQMDIEICGFLKKNDANVWYQIRWMNGLDANRMGETLKFPPILMSLNYAENNTLKAPKSTKDIRSVIQSGSDQEMDVWIREGRVPTAISDGVTPLMYAAVHGQHRMIDKMLDHPRLRSSMDAQESVLGMSALMFGVVAGDNQVVLTLLRHGANPRLSSTTKEPFFSAMDLAHFSGLSQDTVLKLYKQYLKAGKLKEAEGKEKSESGEGKSPQQQQGTMGKSPSSGSVGGTSQRRLRRVIESISKNIMGLADELSTGMVGQQFGMPFESFGAPAEVPSARARFDARADTAHLIGAGAPRFLLAEHILRGEARAPVAKAQQQQQQMDTRIVMGRQCAISWRNRGNTLPPILFDDWPSSVKNTAQPMETNGLYLAAQRNADKLLKNTNTMSLKRHRRNKTEPTIAVQYQHHHSDPAVPLPHMPLTPQLRTAQNNQNRTRGSEQKSPSSSSRHKVLLNQCEKTVRKAPHRIGHHHRAASIGSGNGIVQNGNGGKGHGSQAESPQGTTNGEAQPQWTQQQHSSPDNSHNHTHNQNSCTSSSSCSSGRPSLFRVLHNQQQPQQYQAVPESPGGEKHQPKKLYNKRKISTGQQHNHHRSPMLQSTKTPNPLMAMQQKAKPLTKELIQQKVHEWGLAGEFEDCFVAEEVDELTFASLRETEVQEVLTRHGRGEDPGLCHRFVELIDEIKHSTGCSELL